jgi:hypothetical protein
MNGVVEELAETFPRNSAIKGTWMLLSSSGERNGIGKQKMLV